MDVEKEWEEFSKEWAARGPLTADKRVCAVCLNDVDRATYDAHMEAHGYTVLHIGTNAEILGNAP